MKVDTYRCIKDYTCDAFKLTKGKLYDVNSKDQKNGTIFIKEGWFKIQDFDDMLVIENGSKLKEAFTFAPFLDDQIIKKHFKTLKMIETKISEGLSDYPKFQGIDFCDVGAKGIQIRGHHQDIKGYTYGDQPTLKYDMSNSKEIINTFIEMWKMIDTPKRIADELRFIKDGESYGWD